VAFCIWVDDIQTVEKAIQRDLGRYRIRRREFLRVDADTARRAIEAAACSKVAMPMIVRRSAGRPRHMPRVASGGWLGSRSGTGDLAFGKCLQQLPA
jgi:hypothetical protein